MSHLMGSTANFEAYEKIEPIGVGSTVTYHTRIGNQRQGRTTFPALVLSQAPDDGSVDLMVFLEPEDILWERRVPRWTEQQPGRCWSPVDNRPLSDKELHLTESLKLLGEKVFGDFEQPDKSVMEYLADFDVRLTALEQFLVVDNPTKGRKGK